MIFCIPASGGDGILGPKGSGVRRGARSSMDASSPGLGRKFTGAPDSAPVPAAALQTSIWLRLQFLLPLLPMIQTERYDCNLIVTRQPGSAVGTFVENVGFSLLNS